jgi:hypothetical protein
MNILLIVFAVQAILGVIAFEWAWKRTERQRTTVEERDSQFPAFRRLDVHLWRKLKFYPGAIFVLIPRLLVAFFTLFGSYFIQSFLYLGLSK